MLENKLEERRQIIVKKRIAESKCFAGPELLKQTIPESEPKSTKTSKRFSYRPRVFSTCRLRRKDWLDFYFNSYYKHREASAKFRKDFFATIIPDGMFPP